MRWNLRLAAANRGIWKASQLQRMLADHGLSISAGKMSGLWSGDPASIKLSDLDVICVVLGCEVGELLIPEPDKVQRPIEAGQDQQDQQDQPATAASSASSSGRPPVTPKRRDRRSLPPG
jgi:DNA-binding Xre family transcriptional regulator